ncbi:hypothetical protein ACH4L5_03015 [Streptomyces sp. NPDC017405]
MLGTRHFITVGLYGCHFKWRCSCGKFGAGGRDRKDTWRRAERHIPKNY